MLRWALAVGRTPRELLASTTSADITEMMAFEQLEPFGAIALQDAAGRICAATVNLHRDPKTTPEPLRARDFFPSLAAALDGYREAEPEAARPLTAQERSNLIDASIFGIVPTTLQ